MTKRTLVLTDNNITDSIPYYKCYCRLYYCYWLKVVFHFEIFQRSKGKRIMLKEQIDDIRFHDFSCVHMIHLACGGNMTIQTANDILYTGAQLLIFISKNLQDCRHFSKSDNASNCVCCLWVMCSFTRYFYNCENLVILVS